MRIEDLLKFTILKLKNSESAAMDARLFFMEVTGWNHAQLIANADNSLTSEQIKTIDGFMKRRMEGEPVAYILGHQDFFKYRFIVNNQVLIPRPDTELVVEEALKWASPAAEIADLGCGSGCIGLSVLKERYQARLWACDISSGALDVFQQNAVALGLADRVKCSLSNVIENSAENAFDVIVSNPPYIAKDDPRLEEMVRKFEPAAALFAEHKGLACYEQWLPWSFKALKPRGVAVFEFGEGQASSVKVIAKLSGFKSTEIKKDLSGKDRVLVAVKG